MSEGSRPFRPSSCRLQSQWPLAPPSPFSTVTTLLSPGSGLASVPHFQFPLALDLLYPDQGLHRGSLLQPPVPPITSVSATPDCTVPLGHSLTVLSLLTLDSLPLVPDCFTLDLYFSLLPGHRHGHTHPVIKPCPLSIQT